MQLSEHFTLEEMIASSTAVRRGIPNNPTNEQIESLSHLCQHILEPVRAHYGVPVHVTSGFRCVALNEAVGGAATSQHCFGEAVDFHVTGVPDLDVANWIAANLTFDQLILEFPPEGWVHCSYGPRMRGSLLTAKHVNGATKYISGFHP